MGLQRCGHPAKPPPALKGQTTVPGRCWFLERPYARVRSVKSTTSSRVRPSAQVQITKQLAIFLENKPGTLARVCDALADAGINIHAISTSDTVDHTVMRMVVSDPRKALHVFEERGTLVVEDDVLLVEGRNEPGSLARIAHALANANVNIEYAYCATAPTQETGLLVLRVSDAQKALKVLNLQQTPSSGRKRKASS